MHERRRIPSKGAAKFAAFVHHHHEHELGEGHDEAMVARVRRCLDHFEASDLWARLRGIGCEGWEPLPGGDFGSMPRFVTGRGVEVYAAWGFAATDGTGTVHQCGWRELCPEGKAVCEEGQ